MRSLEQWLQHLESIHPSEIDLGLERIRKVALKLDLLKPAEHVIVVAGTNGKGTTVTTCAQILQCSGRKVGVFTSPHIHHYNERVAINGEVVSDELLIKSFEVVDAARGDITLTYFEVSALSAFYIFKQQNVDAAVLEIGLGGRLDAVNVVEPDVSVVTSIGLDHTDWLGDTLDKIGYEKAGVYRKNKPAICGQVNPPNGLIDHAKQLGAQLLVKGEAFSYDSSHINDTGQWSWQGQDTNGNAIQLEHLPKPKLPLENVATALQTLMSLNIDISQQALKQGIETAYIGGRLEPIDKPFKGLMDVGHNQQAAQFLSQQLPPIKGRCFAVLAMLADKDPLAVVNALNQQVDTWYFAGLDGYRGQSGQALAAKLAQTKVESNIFDSVAQALDAVVLEADENDFVLIFGSFFTVAQAQAWLENNNG
ncbi:bifunctional tetrahydrofolate synthase/dihydrofolate synthase [Bermanella sp. R86510]|uniref:bifunctional tetrahydrofolate synthase/dihydrofolate synthase n=1 Tax=unclassified Bermanella TaxID=2627862 RepID=UPI0037CB7FFC